ncbi:MAG: carbohydrate kinase family protein [Lachnospiraceae bacterium]|nr:carbohydrate kinase family protein [Lachnospiraceae bacterium]
MSKFVVCGITQLETIVKVPKIPVEYAKFTASKDYIYTAAGGDAFNISLALTSLGDEVDFMSVVGKGQNLGIFNPPDRTITLSTDHILPILKETPMEVMFFDGERREQKFEDLKDIRDAQYDISLVEKAIPESDMVFLSNVNYCRPFIKIALDNNKPLAVRIHSFHREKEKYNEDYLKAASILYFSDSNIEDDPYDFVNEMAEKYDPMIILIGQGAGGVLLYDKEKDIKIHYDPVKAGTVLNAAGAGNALFACFLHYYQKNGDSKEAIHKALMFTANKIGYIGTSNGFMTEDQLEQWERLIFDPRDTRRFRTM